MPNEIAQPASEDTPVTAEAEIDNNKEGDKQPEGNEEATNGTGPTNLFHENTLDHMPTLTNSEGTGPSNVTNAETTNAERSEIGTGPNKTDPLNSPNTSIMDPGQLSIRELEQFIQTSHETTKEFRREIRRRERLEATRVENETARTTS